MDKGVKIFVSFLISIFLIANIITLASASTEADFLNLMNQERQSLNLNLLSSNSQLETAAHLHSEDMSNNSYFSHTSLDGRTFVNRITAPGYTGYYALGENIAYHTGTPDANKLFTMWKNSPGHYANMISSSYLDAGLGVYYDGKNTYYTLDLGKNKNSVIAPNTSIPPVKTNTSITNNTIINNTTPKPQNNTINITVPNPQPQNQTINYNFSYQIQGRYVTYKFAIKDSSFGSITYSRSFNSGSFSNKVTICSRLTNGACNLKANYRPGNYSALFEIKSKSGYIEKKTINFEIK